jgi:hypothetical protein
MGKRGRRKSTVVGNGRSSELNKQYCKKISGTISEIGKEAWTGGWAQFSVNTLKGHKREIFWAPLFNLISLKGTVA